MEFLNFQLQEEDDFLEGDFLSNAEETTVEETQLPKGAPVNLLELLENCHEMVPCLDISSCASSDCGEGNGESPLKRRKRRKNRTGWPGNKLRRKLHSKQMAAYEYEKKSDVSSQLSSVKEESRDRLADPNREGLTERVIRNEEKRTSKSSGSCSFGDCGEKRNRSSDTPDRRSQSSEDSKSEKSSKEKESSEYEEMSSKKDAKGKKESLTETEEVLSRRDSSKSRKEATSESEEIFSKKDTFSVKKETSSETEDTSSNRELSQASESSLGNEENVKIGNKKPHRRLLASSSDRESLTRRVMRNNVSPRKRSMTKALIRSRSHRRTAGSSETRVITFKTKSGSRLRQKLSIKRPGGGRASSPSVLEDSKKNSYVNMSPRTRLRRIRGGLSSDPGDVGCSFSERVNSPVVASSDLSNRRSSIEFQPVVRVMKIEDQVDRDHSILSVAVASNRRLRSSGSPKSNQPPKKKFKSGRGHFSRWLKTS